MYDNRTDKWYKRGKLRSFFKGKLRGYPGLKSTAYLIANYIPDCKIYVEPFAGLGRVAKFVRAEQVILNDMSPFAADYLHKHFPDANILEYDFGEIFNSYDSKDTFFLIDPPWSKTMYEQDHAFCDRSANEYYNDILEILPKLKGDWILCSNHTRKFQTEYFEKILVSKRKIMGYHIKVKLLSNKPFIECGLIQSTLVCL